VNSVKTSKHIFKFFSRSGIHTILVFFIPNVMTIFRRGLPNGASNASGVGRNRDFRSVSGFIACCQRCVRLGVINTVSPDHGPASVTLIAGSKRRSLLIAGDDDKIFMTRSLNVTPKTTEHKSVAYVTNNKRLCSTFCTIEAHH